MKRAFLAAALFAICSPVAFPAAADGRADTPEAQILPGPPKEVGFDQKIGAALPLDAEFRDEDGKVVRLGDYFGKRPVLLTLAYFDCPMLCGMSLHGVASSLKGISFSAGKEFEVVTVSFDPREKPKDARIRKVEMLDHYGRKDAAPYWHFLTGDEASIKRLTSAVGFRYVWDEKQKQYAHATGLVVATPQGVVSRYFFGIEYAPKELRLGLVEATNGRLGSVVDQLLLLCYHYDPKVGKYSLAALKALRVAAAFTMISLGAFVVVMLRRERTTR